LLDALSDEQRQAVEARSSRRTVAAGGVVFHHGDRGDFVVIVERGRLAVQLSTVEGQTATLRVIGPGDVVGELALLLPGARRSASVVAIEPSELRIIHQAVFQDVRARHPEIDRALVDDLAARLDRLSNQLIVARYGTIAQRVAGQLLVLDDLYLHEWIPMTQDALASLTGGTRQTVNGALGDARSAGLIDLRRGAVRVLDRVGLGALAG